MNFFATLPSNASTGVYPNNAVSHFTTLLQKPLQLSSNWEVALVEATVPTRWVNILSSEYIRIKLMAYSKIDANNPDSKRIGFAWYKRSIPEHNYETIDNLLDVLNKSIHSMFIKNGAQKFGSEHRATQHIAYQKYLHYEDGVVSFTGDFSLQISGVLALVLGYGNGESPRVAIRKGKNNRPINLYRGWTNIFVYSDIVSYQVVGDTLAPLLRVIPMTSYKGSHNMDHYTHIFNNPHYVPVSRHFIENIHIDLRSDTGEFIPFLNGKSIVKLHFRTKQPI